MMKLSFYFHPYSTTGLPRWPPILSTLLILSIPLGQNQRLTSAAPLQVNTPHNSRLSDLKSDLPMEVPPHCHQNWTQSADNPAICYNQPVQAISKTVYGVIRAGDICMSQMGNIVMPKDEEEINYLFQIVDESGDDTKRNAEKPRKHTDLSNINREAFENAQYIVYVGLINFPGYWSWLDNSTFDGTWCSSPNPTTYKDGCGVLLYNYDGSHCFAAVDCNVDNVYEPSVTYKNFLVCSEQIIPKSTWCPPGWLSRPDSQDCYHFSKQYDVTNWVDGFCQCHGHNSVLANFDTMAEAMWLAGNIRRFGWMTDSFSIGLTTLAPLDDWTWSSGVPLEPWSKLFWYPEQQLPTAAPPTASADVGSQCGRISWADSQHDMWPNLQTASCTTAKFSQTVMQLAAKYCPR